jgi:uncharacterized protein YqfB (UPF0267 family)
MEGGGMKRLTFKPEFRDDILSGRKTATIRASNKHLLVGDKVAAVNHFLTPAKEAFAILEITEEQAVFWKYVTNGHKARTLASDEWYAAHIPMLSDMTLVWFYGFSAGEVKNA